LELFRVSGKDHPADLTPADLVAWCSAPKGNNSIRSRVSVVSVFFRWAMRAGHITVNIAEHVTGADSPLRNYQRVYGKAQSPNPGRWLTKEQAFTELVAACQDGSDLGLRDEVVVRLGLLGMRASEIGRLEVGNLHIDDSAPSITWTGKRYKPRRIVPGAQLIAVLREYLARYADAIGRPLQPTDPIVCPQVLGTHGRPRLRWGTASTDAHQAVYKIVRTRSADAGLGHVAPHDLRRTAAGILHRSTDGNGKHDFDLLDIQKVLGHSDPVITMRAYLDPMDNGVIERASTFLD